MKIRRLLAVTVTSLALLAVLPAAHAAAPATGKWVGTKVELGQDLKFKVKGKKIVKITANVLENCSGSSTSTWTTFAPDSSWKIKGNGSFSGRKKEKYGSLTAYMTFKGKFTSKRKARGKLRQETIVAGSVCDTYELDWKAKAK
jgi:hypothetical protein